MGGITCNAEGFAGETGAVDVLEGGERDTNDLLSCSHYALKGLAAGCVASAIPHSDAAVISIAYPFQACQDLYASRSGVGNVDPGGPVSLQSLAPTLIKHT